MSIKTNKREDGYESREETNDELLKRLSPEIQAARSKITALCKKFDRDLADICNPVGIVFDMSVKFGICAHSGLADPDKPALLN